MPVSLKAICDKVLGESGFQIPTAYLGSSLSPDDAQMAYIANAAADGIREKAPQVIRKMGTVTLTVATSYDLPTDFLGYVPDTAYTEGRLDPVLLATASQWNEWIANSNPGGIQVRARFLAGKLQIIQPESGTVITYEYVSNSPWTDATGLAAKEQATVDTDLCLIDRRLMETALKWRWKKEKGLPDWQVDRSDYVQQLNSWRARDQGARTLQFGDAPCPDPAPYTNLWVP